MGIDRNCGILPTENDFCSSPSFMYRANTFVVVPQLLKSRISLTNLCCAVIEPARATTPRSRAASPLGNLSFIHKSAAFLAAEFKQL